VIITAQVTPPNSMVLVISSADPDIPALEDAVAATATCVSVGTLSETDGPTTITLTDEDVPLDGLASMYRGQLDTALRRVAVQSVEGDQISEITVPAIASTIEVFGSDPFEPDRIVIRLS
jgi:hypothetical protein